MSLARAVRDLLDDLDEAGIAHMVVGGVALDALGVPRTTYDVDVQIDPEEGPEATASTVLGRVVEERSHDPVFDQDVLVVHSAINPVPVEIFLTSHWFTRQALRRRQAIDSTVVGRPVPVPTPEDFLLLKAAFWVAPSRSRRKAAQDGVDLEGVVDAHRDDLDLAYLEDNGEKLGVWDDLREVLDGGT